MPTREGAIALMRSVGCADYVVAHCEAVEELAVRIARRCGADQRLVSVGALLHDIGRSRTHGMSHAIAGARLAMELGLPERIARIIERHIGAGLTASEARALGLPSKSYIPKTLEEKIVAHADNLVGTLKSPTKRIASKQAAERLLKNGTRGGAKRLIALHKELSKKCGIDLDELD
ncbi:MAG: HDIG domain-containing protein [Euryarchaeota archaeon]|nr:HDIG domain-containing protein [Euryarchaeota archaeon]